MNRAFLLLAASAIALLVPLADASLKGCLLLGLAAAATWLLRRRSAAERHLAWVSAMSLLLLLPLLSALLPGWNILPQSWRLAWEPERPETPVIEEPAAVEPIAPSAPTIDSPLIAMNETSHQQPVLDEIPSLIVPPAPSSDEDEEAAPRPAVAAAPDVIKPQTDPIAATGNSWLALRLSLLGIWLCGTLWFALRLLRSWMQLARLSRRGGVVTQGPLFEQFESCCRELAFGRRVRLLQGEANAMPMAWGLVRPCILVPADCSAWPASQQRAVLLHELGHVIRRDPLWHAIVQFATAVYWFHPLVWLAAWRIHVERERACDDLVLNRGVAAGDYARHLLDVVSNGRLRRIGASVGVAMASNNKLEGRVRSILDNRQDRRPLTRVLLTAGVLIALAVGTPLAMMRAQGNLDDAASDATTEDERLSYGPRFLLGFELTPHRFDGDADDWETLFLAGGPLDRRLPAALGGAWECRYYNSGTGPESSEERRRQGSWHVYYSPLRQVFYVESSPFGELEYYGPIAGNAIDMLGLDNYLIDAVNAEHRLFNESADAYRQIQLLIESGEPTLIASGLRMLVHIDELTLWELERLADLLPRIADSVSSGTVYETEVPQEYVGRVRSAPLPQVPELAELADAAIEYLQAQSDRLDSIKFAYEDSEYTPGRAPTAEELAAYWGPAVDGLSLGLITRHSPVTTDPTSQPALWGDILARQTIEVGEVMDTTLLVRNVSDEPRRVSVHEGRCRFRAMLQDESLDRSLRHSDTLKDGHDVPSRYVLQPGQVILLGQSRLKLAEGDLFPADRMYLPDSQSSSSSGEMHIRAGHDYRIDYSLSLPGDYQYLEDGRIRLPAAGEFHGTLRAPTLQFVAAPAAGNLTATADPQTSASPVTHELLGVDLAPFLYQGDELALFDSGGPLSIDVQIRDSYWSCHIQSYWEVCYSPRSNTTFVHSSFVNVNFDDLDDLIVYGPIAGNPFEVFPLVEYLGDRGERSEHDAIWQLLQSGDPTLVIAGCRVLCEFDEVRAESELRLRQLVNSAAVWMRETPDNSQLLDRTLAALDAHRARIDARKIEVPADQYSPGSEPTAEQLAANWGPAVDGLSLALIPWEQDDPTLRMGDRVETTLVGRNVSDEPIRLATIGFMANVTASLVDDETGEINPIDFPKISQREESPSRYELQPGQVVELKSPLFRTGEKEGFDYSARLEVVAGRTYRLSMSIRLPEFFRADDNGQIRLPARGEYYNELTAGDVHFRVVDVEEAVSSAVESDGPEARTDDNNDSAVGDDASDSGDLAAIEWSMPSMRINYDETMLVAWNEQGAIGLLFETPEPSADGSTPTEVAYRWRFNDGSEEETTSDGTLPLGQGEQMLVFPAVTLIVTDADVASATIAYDPGSVCVHPLDRTYFTEYDRQIPSQPELRPAVDLTTFLLPDESVQQQMRDREYNGQATIPGYPRAPLPCKIRYADNGLVVATPDGVAVFDFLGSLDRREGNIRRQGVEYRWRFVAADGRSEEAGEGEVWELSRDESSVYDESLHYIEAGPIHIPWSINVADAGWLYYDPAWHGVWFIRPDTSHELAETETGPEALLQFAFGPRAVGEPSTRFEVERVNIDEGSAVAGDNVIRGFDLTPYLFTGEWTPLYEPGAPLDRDLSVAEGGCWRCIVNPGEWRLHYSPVRGEFYVHRTTRYGSRQEVAEAVYYGPIEGNPIELLGLEEYLAESINRRHSTDAPGNSEAMGELQFLLTSEDPTLTASGLRVLASLEELEISEEVYLREMVADIAEWMNDTPEQIALLSRADAMLKTQRALIEQRKIEIDASEYAPGSEPDADELAANWGEPVDGLSLAIVPWEQGEPTLRLGERVEAWLVVRNVSEEPIRLATVGYMDGVGTNLFDEETQEEVPVLFPAFDFIRPPQRYELAPGQVLRIKHPAFWARGNLLLLDELAAPIDVVPGHTYRLTMSLQLPESFSHDADGRITVPARDEFYNSLTSGTVRIRVIEIDGTVPPESEEADINDEQFNAQPATDNNSGFRRSLHGFDLTPHRFTGDWEALFEIDGPLYRGLPVALGGVWECRVNNHAWRMYYSPLKQFFYVHLRDGDASEYFGPIEGNAIELLKIEEHLVNSFNRSIGTDLVETSFNLRYIESLIESQEPTLMASGFRALTRLDELAIYEERRMRPVVERVAEEVKTGWINDPTVPPELVDRVQPLELIQVPELSDLADAALAYMDEQHARIEALKVSIDDSEYTPGRAPTDEELAAEWGPEVDGLSLAVMTSCEHVIATPTRPNAASDRSVNSDGIIPPPGFALVEFVTWDRQPLNIGNTIRSDLLVRNVSNEPRRIGTLNTLDGVGAVMTDEETGYSALLSHAGVSGIPLTERYLLQPGEVVTLKQSDIQLVEGDLHSADRPFNPDNRDILYSAIRVREGRSYTIDYSVDVPSAFSYVGEGGIALPAKGEFHGLLNAPPMRFEVAATVTAINDEEAPGELSVLHEGADGTMRLTPTNEEERELVNQILTWGSNDRDGWRVGALLVNDLDSDEPLTAGDPAGVRYFLQNVTDQPKSILVAPMGDSLPVMGAGGRISLNTQAGSGTVEITAQPGEAVSPDGHFVLADTTGLPDGEYELDTTAAFWMQNADGSGSSSPWRVGSVLMTIGEGGRFDGESMTDDEGIVWGGTVAGLRVGMRMPEGKVQWANGSLLQGDLFVKNTTDEPIEFTWDKPAPMDQNQVVYTAEGEYVQLNRVFYTGGRAQNPQTFTVGPGEQILLGDAKLQSVAEASEPGPEDPAQLVAATGSFTWQVHVQLNVPSIPQFLFVVGSGPVPFEIVWSTDEEWPEGVEDDTNDDPANDDAVPPDDNATGESPMDEANPSELSVLYEDDDGTLRFTPTNAEERELVDQILTWTDAVEGWRVGSLLMNDLESDEPLERGEAATVRYFMQNVTDQPMSITVAPIDGWSRDLRAGGWIVIETLPGSGPVEFTAQPGEAVSPSGFSVDVDTTGLTDGQYELDATTVFWRQDANGSGASSPWRVAGVPVTVGTGGSLASETMTDDEGIHWGEVVSGLRFGMRLVDGKHEWAVGSLIEADLYVKNTTDEPITFTWDAPPPGEEGQTIYNSDWEIAQVRATFYTGIRLPNERTFIVAAGEQIVLGKARLLSVSEASTPAVSDPVQLVADSGKFYWVMNVFVQVTSVPQIGILLGSGTEEFEIVSADTNEAPSEEDVNPQDDGSEATPDDDAPPDAEALEQDDLESSISWGEPADGWRAGMKIAGDAVVEAGEQVMVQFYVQNTSDEEATLWFGLIENATPVLHAGGVIRCNAFWARSAPIFVPTTITAAPGEIEQLENQSITVDTTGLPDGDYSIEANAGNHAEWILDSEGAATNKHLMTPARLRIGRGGQFPDVTGLPVEIGPQDQIYWGYEVAGLRIGLQMNDRQLEWPVGSRIESRIVAENLTREEIEFTTWWGLPPDHDFSIFEDPNTPVDLDIRKLTVFQDFNRTFRVPAGEQLELGTLAVDSRTEFENYEAGQPPRLIAEPGTYRWEAAFNFTRPDLPGFTCRMQTGRAYFDLTAD